MFLGSQIAISSIVLVSPKISTVVSTELQSPTGYMEHFMLIGGIDENSKIYASTRSYDPDMWTDDVVMLPHYLHKSLPISLAYTAVGLIDGAIILCGGIERPTGRATKTCRDYT